MNVLVLGSRIIAGELAKDLVRDYLRANFTHRKRARPTC
jgi:ribose 5-phosphate isomerase RpiB